MSDSAKIARIYISAWNETDPKRRKELVAESLTETASYVDPLMQGEGHAEIETMIGAVQERFPGFRFALQGPVDGYGDRIRFSWVLGPESEADIIKGTDFAVLEEGRMKAVTGFLDKVPTAA